MVAPLDETAHTVEQAAEIFLHVRVIMGIIVGLGIARLLNGLTFFVQHPGRRQLSAIHLLWAASVLLTLVHFWWWEFWLTEIVKWNFQIYLFLIAYAILFHLLCTLLFPEVIDDYDGYEQFFIARRRWFFGILGVTFVFDFFDTIIKGWHHLEGFGLEYKIYLPASIFFCTVAFFTTNRRFHLTYAAAALSYKLAFIVRLFDTLN